MKFSWLTKLNRPFVVAHRGSSAVTPENTHASFKQAMIDGADAIEIDVQLTKDGEVVVIHDASVNRTTDGKGKVCNMTLPELKKLDAGSWFDKKYSMEKIPTLEEVFKITQGHIGINIEVKSISNKKNDYTIINPLLKIIDKYRMSKIVLLSSFNHSIIKKIKTIKSDLFTGVIYSPAYCLFKKPSLITSRAGADFFVCNNNYLSKKMVNDAHQRGISVGTYVINSEKSLKKAMEFKVDCIVTDNPRLIADAINRNIKEEL